MEVINKVEKMFKDRNIEFVKVEDCGVLYYSSIVNDKKFMLCVACNCIIGSIENGQLRLATDPSANDKVIQDLCSDLDKEVA